MNMPQMPGANFTHKAQQAILYSQKIAGERNKNKISPLHLLYALLSQKESAVSTLLETKGVNVPKLKQKVEREMDKGRDIISPTETGPTGPGQFYLSRAMAEILKEASAEAERMGDSYISVEHLFLALLEVDSTAGNLIESADFLPASKGGPEDGDGDMDYESLKEDLKEIRGDEPITDPRPESKMKTIERYTINMTEMAEKGETDPVIGREKETRRVMQVLSRRTKNNPVLIGGAGVGKTAIAEGLAQKIAKKQVPESLKNKQVISLDLGSLVAGTRYRGEFENRMKALLKEVKRNSDKYILFIDELHTLVGAGAAEGSIDASNLLKPDLARGKLRAIGATTQKEYQKYIEKDSALERRFQPIHVDEPSVDETVFILRGIKEKYELHHGVKIEDSALKAAAELSSRYINDRNLPDKAIDLMDEAMSSLRLQVESQPKKLEDLEKKIQNLEIEKEAIKEEKGNKKRMQAIERELADLNEKAKDLSARWNTERKTIKEIKEIKEKIDKLEYEAEKAGQQADLERVAKIKYGEIPSLRKKLQTREKRLANIQKERPILKETVSDQDIAEVISRWTGIPSNKLLEEEAKKLKRMEKIISRRVIGQDKAISAISNAIRRSRAGVSEESKPLGSFLFLGPTGVGKTETAKALSEFLFDDENSMIKLDMSEYMEKHSVSKMIGAPPGYIGHDDAGQLTEQIRRKPYSVVLIDEVEKAHREVFNILLQVFEEGRLTDTKGREVSFKNAIIIMTSNVGSEYISEMTGLGFSDKGKAEAKKEVIEDNVKEELKKQFRPEFLNRIDEIVIFNHLEMKQVKEIVGLELDKVKKRVMKNNGVKLEFKRSVKRELAEKGFDRDMGARPLKRVIQKEILNPLALKLISGRVSIGEKITVRIRDGEIDFQTPNDIRKEAKSKKEALVK